MIKFYLLSDTGKELLFINTQIEHPQAVPIEDEHIIYDSFIYRVILVNRVYTKSFGNLKQINVFLELKSKES